MGYLCKYLKRSGIEVVVLTEAIEDETFEFLQNEAEVHYIQFYKRGNRAGWLKTLLLDTFFGYKDRRMYRKALKVAHGRHFDLLLCSTFRTFPLPAARRTAQKLHIPFVADLRDIIEQFAGNEFIAHPLPRLLGLENLIALIFKHINLWQRNRALRRAACITTISPWHQKTLAPFNPHPVKLIYNGFDPELFYPAPVESDCFTIAYTGRLLSASMRNPALLFEAVARLAEAQIITPQTFRIDWFTDSKSEQIIKNEASAYPIADFMNFRGYIPANEIPRALNACGIILLLTNQANKKGPKGVMTTKFFEAIAVEKPVLCVRGDEACLEDAIRATRSGIAAHNVDEAIAFIEKYYRQWLENKHTAIDIDRAEAEKFSRKTQAQQFIRIFEQIISSYG
jgi:glycosyltransferase involved in cell wall biosynthesis